MTRKEKILRMMQRQDDNVSYAEVVDRIVLMGKVEVASAQADRGEGTEHEGLFLRLEKEWQEQASELNGPPRRNKTSKKSAGSSPKTRPAAQPHSRTG